MTVGEIILLILIVIIILALGQKVRRNLRHRLPK